MPLADRLEARVELPIDVDDLVVVAGNLWLKSESGYVVQVDARTNRVLRKQLVDDPGLPFRRHCQGIGTDGASVWTCATHLRSTSIVRLDPRSGRVLESFAVDKYADQLRLTFALGRIWVLTDEGRTLVGLAGGAEVRRVPLDRTCGQVTGSGEDLVLSCFPDGYVERVDPASGKVLASAEVPQPGVLSATDDDVWVGSTDGLLRLDAGTLRRKAVFAQLSPLLFGDVRATDEQVWLRLKGAQLLYRIDPGDNRVAELVEGDPNLSSGSLLVNDDVIWTTAYDNQLLLRLSPGP